MKQPTLLRVLPLALLALLLGTVHAFSGTPFDATMDLVINNTLYPPDSTFIKLCSDSVQLQTRFVNYDHGDLHITQTLPLGCTFEPGSFILNNCPLPTYNPGDNFIVYTIPGIPNGVTTPASCGVKATLLIPCDAHPDAFGQFNITFSNLMPDSPPHTINAPAYPLQFIKPNMLIQNFSDENGAPVGVNGPNPPPQLLNVSPHHYRQFYCEVTDGPIKEFTFFYNNPPGQITPTSFDFVGVRADGTVLSSYATAFSGLAPAATFFITPAMISQLFENNMNGGRLMSAGERIRVREHFNVIACSPVPNIPTTYAITWDCGEDNTSQNVPAIDHGCNTATAVRFIKTATSINGITPSYRLTPDLAFCSVSPATDLYLDFANSSFDTYVTHPEDNKIYGSATKTLQTISFPLKLDDLGLPVVPAPNSVFLENASGTLSRDVTTIPGFYTYTGGRVVLNFNSFLFTSPLGGTGPFIDGFIPNNVYNELVDGQSFSLHYKQCVSFDCRSFTRSADYNPFYASAGFPSGFGFHDCDKPAFGYLFFGDGAANSYFDIQYLDMCQTPHLDHPNANFVNYAASTSIIEATVPAHPGQIDISPGEEGQIDYRYNSPGYPNPMYPPPSPFLFTGHFSGTPYFHCDQTTYRVLLDVPDFYCVNTVDYYPDPNSTDHKHTYITTGAPDGITTFGLPGGTDDNGVTLGGTVHYILMDPFLGFNGRLVVHVTLCYCPPYPHVAGDPPYGGYDIFSARVQALCDNCTDCAYTTICLTSGLERHCDVLCLESGETPPPQSTKSLSVLRTTLGTRETDPTHTITVVPPPFGMDDISTGMGYPCDVFHVKPVFYSIFRNFSKIR